MLVSASEYPGYGGAPARKPERSYHTSLNFLIPEGENSGAARVFRKGR